MASERKYRKKWLRWLKQYNRYSYKQLKTVFNTWGKTIDFENLTPENYEEIINDGIDLELLNEAYYNIYSKIGRLHGNRTGSEINRELKDFVPGLFITALTRDIINELKLGVERITLVADTYKETIASLVTSRFDENLTTVQLSRQIQETVNKPSFYRWQAKRIARTESTAAANHGALIAGETAGFQMQKMWISSQDSRTRRTPPDQFDHLHMNKVVVDYEKTFNVGGDKLRYPGDVQKGRAGNTINCRCALSVTPKRDANGSLISTD